MLQRAQQQALRANQHLVIVESDVIIQSDTLPRMLAEVHEGVGMVAAVTEDEQGEYNFPYHYYNKPRYHNQRIKVSNSLTKVNGCLV